MQDPAWGIHADIVNNQCRKANKKKEINRQPNK